MKTKMYEGFNNRSLTDKVKDFYQGNKRLAIESIAFLAVIGALGTCAVHYGSESLNYAKKNQPVIERAAEMPRSNDKDLRFNYEKVYGQYWKTEKK